MQKTPSMVNSNAGGIQQMGSGGGPVESGGGSERGSGEGLVRVRWGFR